ncbi:MAG TPA: hypothetical protein VET87_22620 [Rubrivivax sp.]|nr:hypothetical protein [Rubrivivax sp.]
MSTPQLGCGLPRETTTPQIAPGSILSNSANIERPPDCAAIEWSHIQQQQSALAESALDRVFDVPGGDDRVLDAAG